MGYLDFISTLFNADSEGNDDIAPSSNWKENFGEGTNGQTPPAEENPVAAPASTNITAESPEPNRGGTGGLAFVGPTKDGDNQEPSSGFTKYLDNAKEFEGVPYKSGGADRTGMDCSGLVCAATGSERSAWTTESKGLPPGNWSMVSEGPQGPKNFSKSLEKGDLLVWPKQELRGEHKRGHTAFYVGGDTIFHAHGKPGTPTGFTNDLNRFWIPTKGTPNAYRPYP